MNYNDCTTRKGSQYQSIIMLVLVCFLWMMTFFWNDTCEITTEDDRDLSQAYRHFGSKYRYDTVFGNKLTVVTLILTTAASNCFRSIIFAPDNSQTDQQPALSHFIFSKNLSRPFTVFPGSGAFRLRT